MDEFLLICTCMAAASVFYCIIKEDVAPLREKAAEDKTLKLMEMIEETLQEQLESSSLAAQASSSAVVRILKAPPPPPAAAASSEEQASSSEEEGEVEQQQPRELTKRLRAPTPVPRASFQASSGALRPWSGRLRQRAQKQA